MSPAELKGFRKLLFLSSAEAARTIGKCSVMSWNRYERGERPVPVDIETRMLKEIHFRNRSIITKLPSFGTITKRNASPQWYSTLAEWKSKDPSVRHYSIIDANSKE